MIETFDDDSFAWDDPDDSGDWGDKAESYELDFDECGSFLVRGVSFRGQKIVILIARTRFLLQPTPRRAVMGCLGFVKELEFA